MSAPLAETLLWLCRIPSPIGEERALCDAVAERLGLLSLASPIRRYGDSLVVPLTRGTGRSHVLLAGHLDVVRTEHDAPPRIDGERLYGAGAADMKSGLSLLIALAEADERPNVDLTLVFYAREEGPFVENELGRVLDEDPEVRHADVAVALEPSDNKLQLGCGGSVHARVTFQGKTAHSARPWQGKNAIHGAAGLLARLAALEPKPDVIDDLEWKSVISATLASGGRAKNVIPDRFELNLNHRFGPATSLDGAKANIEQLVQGEADIEYIDLAPSAPPERRHPLIAALAESGVLAVEPKQAWTDVARFAAAGVPAVNFGPGVQAQAHQRNEWTLIAGLDTGRKILDRWLARLAGAASVVAAFSAMTALSGCDEGHAASRERSDPTTATSRARPLFERDSVERLLESLRAQAAGARLLSLDLREHHAAIQREDPAKPGRVLEHESRDGTLGEPRVAELRGEGHLEANLFPVAGVKLERIPEIVTRAATEVDPMHGKVTRVLVRRHLPKTDAVRFRVFVDSPRLGGHVDFDADGNLLEQSH